mgnify:CR=1 FL=1
MNTQAILAALEDCPGLIAGKLTDGKGNYCVLGWLAVKAGAPADALADALWDQEGRTRPTVVRAKFRLFEIPGYTDLITVNNQPYRSRKARLQAVRGYVAAQGRESGEHYEYLSRL